MKRVVITGMGLVSPLGNNKTETLESLRETRSGIKFQEEYEEMGLRSHVAGSIDIDVESLIDRKLRRFMGDASAFAYKFTFCIATGFSFVIKDIYIHRQPTAL